MVVAVVAELVLAAVVAMVAELVLAVVAVGVLEAAVPNSPRWWSPSSCSRWSRWSRT
jgi:hypothetical protein